jgi:hypothetical protein
MQTDPTLRVLIVDDTRVLRELLALTVENDDRFSGFQAAGLWSRVLAGFRRLEVSWVHLTVRAHLRPDTAIARSRGRRHRPAGTEDWLSMRPVSVPILGRLESMGAGFT